MPPLFLLKIQLEKRQQDLLDWRMAQVLSSMAVAHWQAG
jgi:hypothetical protein